jgi:hypothetical protein
MPRIPTGLVRTLVSALALAAQPSLAAPPRAPLPPGDPEATMVQELVVTSHVGGPAWWRVSTSTSTVYVLGVPEAVPKGLEWDTTLLRRRLTGANELIAPASVSVGLGDLFPLLAARKHFRSHGPMENSLPPELRARFLADRPALNPDPRAYSGWTPLVASLLVVSDFRRRAHLKPFEPADTVVRIARSQGVRVAPAGAYKVLPFVRAAETGLDTSGPACLADVLDEVEAGPGLIDRAAEGWARGDVAAALSAQRGYEKCLNSLPAGADLPVKAMSDTAAAIAAALARPGHSVAVVNLRTLLAQDGVLRRLQARGLSVATPDS